MKIYTRTGDAGDTALFGGARVSKDHVRVAAYGAVDELNATIGSAVAAIDDPDVTGRLESIQHDLFAVGSRLATVVREGHSEPKGLPPLPVDRPGEMEAWMDAADQELPPLRAFVLPGGTSGAAALHLARTVCRRAERDVVHLAKHEPVEEEIVMYLNRLSDLLFTLARLDNHRSGTGDVEWAKE